MSIAQEADDEKEAPQQEAQSVASEDRDMEDDEGASAEESSTDEIDEPATNEEDPTDVETPLIFIPTENISEDYAVPFPIDI